MVVLSCCQPFGLFTDKDGGGSVAWRQRASAGVWAQRSDSQRCHKPRYAIQQGHLFNDKQRNVRIRYDRDIYDKAVHYVTVKMSVLRSVHLNKSFLKTLLKKHNQVLFVCALLLFLALDLSDEKLVEDDGAAIVKCKSVKLPLKRIKTTTAHCRGSISFDTERNK